MIKSILAVILLLASTVAAANPYPVKVLRVIDGDTIVIEAKYLPVELKQQLSIRVLGVDTPEKAPRAKCEAEATLAKQASAYTRGLVAKATAVEVDFVDWDKYGGRALGAVRIDGVDLTKSLINNGYGRAYNGGRKQSWCQ